MARLTDDLEQYFHDETIRDAGKTSSSFINETDIKKAEQKEKEEQGRKPDYKTTNRFDGTTKNYEQKGIILVNPKNGFLVDVEKDEEEICNILDKLEQTLNETTEVKQ